MRARLLLALVVLAGCLQAPPPGPAGQADGVQQAGVAVVPVAAVVGVGVPAECVANAVCFGATGFLETLHATAANASVTGFQLRLGAASYLDRVSHEEPVTWSITCRHEDRACARPLLSGTDVLPIDVALHGLQLPLGAHLEVGMETKPRAPVVEFFTSIFATSNVTGTVHLALGPEPPVLNLTRIPIAHDGHTGPCDLAPDCSHWPGGTRWEHAKGKQVVAFNLTATWDASTPLDEQVELALATVDCPASCPDSHRFAGPSPLQARFEGLLYEGVSIEVRPADASGLGVGLGAVRTPVHVEGYIVIVDDEDCKPAADGPRTSC